MFKNVQLNVHVLHIFQTISIHFLLYRETTISRANCCVLVVNNYTELTIFNVTRNGNDVLSS